MQKSKKMMVSLCGLALSSLFIVGNKATVHADTVSGAQNNAITWDSDSDDSQVDSSTQTKTEQADVQKADDHQQNATQPAQNNAEMSTVRSSSEQRPLTNQTKDTEIGSATDNQSSRANLVSKVDDAPADKPVTIINPSNNQVHVHYIKTDGTDAGVSDFVININKSGTGSYQIPSGYQLASGDGKYSVDDNATSKQVAKIRKYGGNWRDTSFTPEEIQYIQNHCTDGPVDDMDFVVSSKTTAMICAHNGYLDEEAMSGRANPESQRIIDKLASYVPRPTDKNASRGAGNQGEILITNETVHHYTFNDNSGSVLSNSSNTVNVVVTKPQHVDPATDARMKAIATRTIQFNFPGSIPPSYKNIVDDKGVLTQTVTFMRTGQEDALTGNLIDNTLTPWKSNNQDPNFIGFPERTLPRIPGYTLKISPISA